MGKKVKGIIAVIFSMVFLTAVLYGCSAQNESQDERVEALLEKGDKAVSVTMYYGYQCYSYYKEDPESIKAVADAFRSMKLEETDQTVDEATSFMIYFVVDDEESVSVNVDQDGVIWLNTEQKFYKALPGTFDYDALAKIYVDSGGNMEPNAACDLNLE